MSKKLKYKVGERLLLEVVVTEVDEHCDDILPYKVGSVNATDDRYVWVNEDELFQQLEAIPAQQSQTIDRAQMAAMIYGDVMKSSESESAIDILKFLGKENETYKYPEHWIEYNSKMAVLHADAIISELNKNSK